MLGYSKMIGNSYSKIFVFESQSFVLIIRTVHSANLSVKIISTKKKN